jgi:membrane dipeptidase
MTTLQKQSKLYGNAIVVDMTAPGSPLAVMTPDEQSTDEWYSAYEEAGCTFISCTVAADHVAYTPEAALTEIAKARHWLLARPERFLLVEAADDIFRAKREGKLGIVLNFQGTLQYQRDLRLVEAFKRLGVHHSLLTYNQKNLVGDGCHERTDAGLSSHGIALIQEMNRVGVLVDVTHAGYRTAMEAIDVSNAPVIMSHCSPSAIFAHERNVPDDQIIAMAKSGGVIGIHGVGIFMSADGRDISARRLFEFLDYTVQLVGTNHVGFGLDYIMHTENARKAVVGKTGDSYKRDSGYHNDEYFFAPPSIMGDVANVMLSQGYSEEDVVNILGGNWVNVFRAVCG